MSAAAPPSTLVSPLGTAFQVRAEGRLESWDTGLTWGGAAAFGFRGPLLGYGLWVGALFADTADESFAASEWSGAVEVAVGPFGLGLQGSSKLGVSLLRVEPKQALRADSETSRAAGYVELELSRPIWLGNFAFLPGIGVRAFLAERAVRVDDAQRLRLFPAIFHGTLGLVYRHR